MKSKAEKQTTESLLQDLMIIHLGLAGVPQHQIREIVGVDMNRVTRVVKHLKRVRRMELTNE